CHSAPLVLPPFPTRRSSDLQGRNLLAGLLGRLDAERLGYFPPLLLHGQQSQGCLLFGASGLASHGSDGRLRLRFGDLGSADEGRSEEHTSELQSRENLVCRL